MKKTVHFPKLLPFIIALFYLLLFPAMANFGAGMRKPETPVSPATTVAIQTDSFTLAPFGKLHLYQPAGALQSVTLMISGDGGWKYGVIDFAKTFAAEGSLVVGVDILQYYKSLKASSDKCYHVAADFLALAAAVEKRAGLKAYQKPVLMGYSSGATLVYALLAQARPGAFLGGISLGFCPESPLSKKFCELNGLTEESVSKGFDLDPDLQLGNRWIVLHGKLDKVCDFPSTSDFVKKTSDAEFIPLENVGHGFSHYADFMPQWKQAYHAILADAVRAEQARRATMPAAASASKLAGLPLDITEANPARKGGRFAVFFSGDGGWYSFEQKISERMAADGVPTVGMDTRSYFWNQKTPQQAAQDLALIMDVYCEKWQKEEVVLIGYSMGAEVLPFILNQLPLDKQMMVRETILLSPAENCDFEIHIAGMLGIGSSDYPYKVLPEIQKIAAPLRKRLLLITGSEENNPMPAQLKNSGVDTATVPGDHHYNNNSSAIYELLKRKGVGGVPGL
ncbi:MAG: hypothetical protein KDD02_07250 [Phaeodactylibacter sp.]|nr:hypothetical protein [Phaeodactylibacter sp.]MCB9300298.1 virulence factor family protein [Lewinellaceae bacterium]